MATGCSHHGEMAHDEKEEVEYGVTVQFLGGTATNSRYNSHLWFVRCPSSIGDANRNQNLTTKASTHHR